MRFGSMGKRTPRFIGPFMIEARIGEVAYRLQLPETQLYFRVCITYFTCLCVHDPSPILFWQTRRRTQSLQVEQRPVRILDRQIRRLRSKEVPLVRVLWRSAELEEETWETEAEMRIRYPDLFSAQQVCALPAPGLVL